ncbi:MAG: hypothetical protein LBR80_05515 [Deltaproteobacteria bacterium]|nr:hypothetical protein [Deltaproteobacteria bacterium]
MAPLPVEDVRRRRQGADVAVSTAAPWTPSFIDLYGKGCQRVGNVRPSRADADGCCLPAELAEAICLKTK